MLWRQLEERARVPRVLTPDSLDRPPQRALAQPSATPSSARYTAESRPARGSSEPSRRFFVESRGIESPATSAPSVANGRENDAAEMTKDDATRPEVSALSAPTDAVEAALAEAIKVATSAGRWDVVAQLARELEARRVARAGNVARLDARARSER